MTSSTISISNLRSVQHQAFSERLYIVATAAIAYIKAGYSYHLSYSCVASYITVTGVLFTQTVTSLIMCY